MMSTCERFNWGNFGLIVIDESHNFRNHEGQRYQRSSSNEAIRARRPQNEGADAVSDSGEHVFARPYATRSI